MKLRPRRSAVKESVDKPNSDEADTEPEMDWVDEYRPSSTANIEETHDSSAEDSTLLVLPVPSKRGIVKGKGKTRGKTLGDQHSFAEIDQEAIMDESRMDPLEQENAIWVSIRSSKATILSIVTEWIDSYRKDKEKATLELLQFFILSSGCRAKITLEMKQSMDIPVMIKEITKNGKFDEKPGGDYPIIMSGLKWKRFKTRFCDFINKLVNLCSESILFDQYLMEWLVPFLVALADSQIRAFRHTATLAILKIMSALVDVNLKFLSNLENNKHQIEAEQEHLGERKRSHKLEVLETKRDEMATCVEDIKLMLNYTFKSLFVHRFKDVVPEIRVLCISELGIWMKQFPSFFLDDTHLKYAGWSLYDKNGEVRLKCLQGILPLYQTEGTYQKMELFTNKFKERILGMTMDKEPDVAVIAIQLITAIDKAFHDLFTDQDFEQIYAQIYSINRNIAQTAGEFLFQRLINVNLSDDVERESCSARGKKRSKNTPFFRDLITFFIESDIHEHCTYLVDSLFDNEMMKDWECMTDLLLEEPGSDEEPLDNKQEGVLIDIMVCAIKQAATGEVPVGRVSNKKAKATAKDTASLDEEKAKISSHFSTVLPNLLRKYKPETEKIANLLTIPNYFVYETYAQKSDDLEKLFSILNEIVNIHSNSDVIEASARVYEHLQNENFSHFRMAQVEMSSLLDTLLIKYENALNRFTDIDICELESVNFIMKKTAPIVACCLHVDYKAIWDLFFNRWVENVNLSESNELVCEATLSAFNMCYYSLIWELHSLSSSTEPNKRKVDSTGDKLKKFVIESYKLLGHSNTKLSDEVYCALCDLYVIFGPQLVEDDPPLPELVCRPVKTHMNHLTSYLMSRVFVYEEEKEGDDALNNLAVEKCHNRRHLLAGFCKLITLSIIPMHYATVILRHYSNFFIDYTDMIKALISKMKDLSRVQCIKTMVSTLIDSFKDNVLVRLASDSQEAISPEEQEETLSEIKELAKKLVLTFGIDNQKNRDMFVALHKEGINFAIQDDTSTTEPPPHILFLEVLADLSNRLLSQDKRAILGYLDKSLENNTILKVGKKWEPLVHYRKTLSESILRPPKLPLKQYEGRRRAGQKRALDSDGTSPPSETPLKRTRSRYVSFSVSNIEDSTTSSFWND